MTLQSQAEKEKPTTDTEEVGPKPRKELTSDTGEVEQIIDAGDQKGETPPQGRESPSPLILPSLTLQSQAIREKLTTDTEEVGPMPRKEQQKAKTRPSISFKKVSPTNYLKWNMP